MATTPETELPRLRQQLLETTATTAVSGGRYPFVVVEALTWTLAFHIARLFAADQARELAAATAQLLRHQVEVNVEDLRRPQ